MQSNPSREAFHKWMLFKNPKHKISDDGIMDRLFLECWQAGAQAERDRINAEKLRNRAPIIWAEYE